MSMIPRPEYPRPQFVRSGWMNLNGIWQFEIDNGRSGEARNLSAVGVPLSDTITVPFCPESTDKTVDIFFLPLDTGQI